MSTDPNPESNSHIEPSLLPLWERVQARQAAATSGPHADSSSPATGTIRSHDDMDHDETDNFNPFGPLPLPVNALFTVEDGRVLKRHKNLSSESDADAEVFLKVSN